MIMKEKKTFTCRGSSQKAKEGGYFNDSIASSLAEEPVMVQGLKEPDIEAAPRPGRAGICYF